MKTTRYFALIAIALAPFALAHAQPNDAQIAAIVVTANQVDIDAGQLAADATSNSAMLAPFLLQSVRQNPKRIRHHFAGG